MQNATSSIYRYRKEIHIGIRALTFRKHKCDCLRVSYSTMLVISLVQIEHNFAGKWTVDIAAFGQFYSGFIYRNVF